MNNIFNFYIFLITFTVSKLWEVKIITVLLKHMLRVHKTKGEHNNFMYLKKKSATLYSRQIFIYLVLAHVAIGFSPMYPLRVTVWCGFWHHCPILLWKCCWKRLFGQQWTIQRNGKVLLYPIDFFQKLSPRSWKTMLTGCVDCQANRESFLNEVIFHKPWERLLFRTN